MQTPLIMGDSITVTFRLTNGSKIIQTLTTNTDSIILDEDVHHLDEEQVKTELTDVNVTEDMNIDNDIFTRVCDNEQAIMKKMPI